MQGPMTRPYEGNFTPDAFAIYAASPQQGKRSGKLSAEEEVRSSSRSAAAHQPGKYVG